MVSFCVDTEEKETQNGSTIFQSVKLSDANIQTYQYTSSSASMLPRPPLSISLLRNELKLECSYCMQKTHHRFDQLSIKPYIRYVACLSAIKRKC